MPVEERWQYFYLNSLNLLVFFKFLNFEKLLKIFRYLEKNTGNFSCSVEFFIPSSVSNYKKKNEWLVTLHISAAFARILQQGYLILTFLMIEYLTFYSDQRRFQCQ